MLPVIRALCLTLGCAPYLLYFGLLTGATLGGNLTPIGASANIAGIGILRKAGYEVRTKDFLRIGVPFTLCAVIVGYLFCRFPEGCRCNAGSGRLLIPETDKKWTVEQSAVHFS